jgi:LuxR family maltose regulon positive regulatory protein
MAGDHENFRGLASTLLAPRLATEWPFMETAVELVRGQLAILRQDWRTAEAALEDSVRTHQRFRMPMTYGDPRISLAYMHLLREDRRACWLAFEPCLREVIEQQAIGLLLLEPAAVTTALLAAVPGDERGTPGFDTLAPKLALWRDASPEPAPAIGPLAVLSEREHEVLARAAAGASNKHIARDLSLSLHTVKRHIANILDKLDCTSRGQAAEVYRRAH